MHCPDVMIPEQWNPGLVENFNEEKQMKNSNERPTLCESALKIRMFESKPKRKFELKWQKRQIEKLVSWTLQCWAALVLVIMLRSVADGQHLDNLDSRPLL